MTYATKANIEVTDVAVAVYFRRLVNRFFKILPIWETGEESIYVYIQNLQIELLGFQSMIEAIGYDADYMALVSILQYLLDNPASEVWLVKREVFNSISLCKQLGERYGTPDQEEVPQ